MFIGTRIGIPALGGVIDQTWTPKRLFAGGVQGAWFDPSDLSTLWQDSAGTTPVASSSDPIGLCHDKSGNGNHWSQATAGARPLWNLSAGLASIVPDGSDDKLTTAATLSLAVPWTIIIAASYPSGSNTTNDIFACVSHASSSSPDYFGVGGRRSVQGLRVVVRGDNASPTVSQVIGQGASNSYPQTTPAVLTAFMDSGTISGRVNGVEKLSPTATTWTTQTETALLGLGHVAAQPPAYQVPLYQAIFAASILSGDDLSNAEAYAAAKAGITL